VFRAVSNFILEQFYPSLDSKEKNNIIIKCKVIIKFRRKER